MEHQMIILKCGAEPELPNLWTVPRTASPEHDLFPLDLSRNSTKTSQTSACCTITATAKPSEFSSESILVYRLQVPRYLIPRTVEHDDKPRATGTHTFALKTYDRADRNHFKREAYILRSFTSSQRYPTKSGRPWTRRRYVNNLTLDFVATNVELGTNQHGGPVYSPPPRSAHHKNEAGRKRSTSYEGDEPAEARDGHGDDGGDDGRSDRRDDNHGGSGAKKQKTGGEERRMACPYFKHDPVKYNRSICCGPGFLGVHRVKEHVYRKHAPPRHYCRRCRSIFKREAELDEHMRSESPCAVVSKVAEDEGCSEEQQRALRARSRSTNNNKTEAHKWRTMYNILFPNARNVPSPYYDDMTTGQQHAVLDTESYAEHLRRELPQIRQELHDQLESEFGHFGKSMHNRLADIVKNVSQKIFESWRYSIRQSTTPVSDETSINTLAGAALVGFPAQVEARKEANTEILSTSNDHHLKEAIGALHPDLPWANPGVTEFGDMTEFSFLMPEHYTSQVDDEDVGNLLQHTCASCYVPPEPACDSAYGSFTGFSDHGFSAWDTTDKAASKSATGNKDTGKKNI